MPRSGYTDCACRDCFEIAIGNGTDPALCHECESAGCDPAGECQQIHAYCSGSADPENPSLCDDCGEVF